MAWDFETDPVFQKELDWIEFTREEIEPLDGVVANPYDISDPMRQSLIPPLQQIVRERGLWALHLRPELGGGGYGQAQVALVNEIIGRSNAGPNYHLGLADGATDVHLITLARQVLRDYNATDDLFPTRHVPKRRAQAREKYAEVLSNLASS
jgi:alkylation response protein AidB-like acyl-CoA dehydrogenase